MDKYTVKYGQNLFDVALQLYGDVSGIADLIKNNEAINLGTDIVIGDVLNWDHTQIVNQTVTQYFQKNNIVVSNGSGNVYYKELSHDVKSIIMIDKDRMHVEWVISGSGTLFIDWGDNTDIQELKLTEDKKTVIHDMDSNVSSSHDYRKIKLLGEFSLGSLLIPQSDVMKMFAIESFDVSEININGNMDIENIGFFNVAENAVYVSMSHIQTGTLLPLISQEKMRDLWINDSQLSQASLDEYFIGLVKSYQDRPPCNVRMWGNSSPSGVYQRPVALFDPKTGLEAMWVLENERGWTIQEIIEPPSKSTLVRRLKDRVGDILVDSVGKRNASIGLPVSEFVSYLNSELQTGVSASTVSRVSMDCFLGHWLSGIRNTNLLAGSSEKKTGTNEYLSWGNITSIFDKFGIGKYVISFDIKTAKPGVVRFYSTPDHFEAFKYIFKKSYLFGTTTEYQRFTFPVDVIISNPLSTTSVAAFFSEYGTGIIPTVKNVKIELGEQATKWTPAPEDNVLLGTLFGARDTVSGNSMGCDLLAGGELRFRHGASYIYSKSLFDKQIHSVSMDRYNPTGTSCVVDGKEVGRILGQSANISTPISFGCYPNQDGTKTNHVDGCMWNIVFNGGDYIIPFPHLGYDTAVGIKHNQTNVNQFVISPVIDGIPNSGGSDYMQKYGAVARRPNLLPTGFPEKIGDGSVAQVWTSGRIGLGGSMAGMRCLLSATLKISEEAKNGGASVSVACVSYKADGSTIGVEKVETVDTSYGIYKKIFVVPAEADNLIVVMSHHPAANLVGRVYGKEISLINVVPEFIPNKPNGSNLLPLLRGDLLISGGSILNETPFRLDLSNGIAQEADTIWNKSRTDVWKESVRLADEYDASKPCEWDMTELNQQFIVDNINTAYLYYLWVKVDAGSYKDIFQYNSPLTGDDRDRCNRYVHLYT